MEVVRRCMKDERVRRFWFDEELQAMLPPFCRGLSVALMVPHSPAMLALWLQSGLDPNIRLFDGSTPLDVAIKRRLVEHIRVLLLYDAESAELSPLNRAQLLGDALKVKELVRAGIVSRRVSLMSVDSADSNATASTEASADSLPALHRAALQGDDEASVARVREELELLGSPEVACELLDEGKLPAAFYAVEAGHLVVIVVVVVVVVVIAVVVGVAVRRNTSRWRASSSSGPTASSALGWTS